MTTSLFNVILENKENPKFVSKKHHLVKLRLDLPTSKYKEVVRVKTLVREMKENSILQKPVAATSPIFFLVVTGAGA